ncbi:hypothetical protein HED60_06045 [Planctomycetales bacterium ZRK34]|nr:hypothetical protein HED60_06045 [Planctomycetales bacterium ZRK34]
MYHVRLFATLMTLTAAGLFTVSSGTLQAAEPHEHADHAVTHEKAVPSAPYLLPNDPVTDHALAEVEHPVAIHYEGRELRFASQASADKFNADPQAYLPAIDAGMIKDQGPRYPLATCLVSGESLTEMGKPVDFIYNNRLIRFCCKHCKGDFLKDPSKFIAKLDAAAIEKQKADYTATTCPVSGEKLGEMGKPADRIVGDHLVRLCCPHCENKLRSNASAYLGKLSTPKDDHHQDHGTHSTP